MKKEFDYLYIAAFVMMAFLMVAAAFKVYTVYDEKKVAEELEEAEMAAVIARNTESQRRVAEMEYEIADMLDDIEKLQEFIDEKVIAANEVQIRKETISVSGNELAVLSGSVSGNISASDNMAVSDNMSVSGNTSVSGNWRISGNGTISANSYVSGNSAESGILPVFSDSVILGNTEKYNDMSVSGNTISGNFAGFNDEDVSGNFSVSGNSSVSGNDSISGNIAGFDGATVSNNAMNLAGLTVSVNRTGDTSGNSNYAGWQYVAPEISLEERRALRTSYEETLEVNQTDKELIVANEYDFSNMKVACLGDSITAAANLENEENYEQYSYPARLKELLGVSEVVNLGIGGSSIGRYWTDAYVDRYSQISEDTDIIIVMGGTNDGFCVSDKEFGNLDDRAPRTFCGDVNELMRGLRENYPAAVIFFATPLPNVLHDYLMSEKEYLLPQRIFADVIRTIAAEYDIETIDLYNSNILDSHDANVIAQYIPDGVHGNHDGYQILAEHFAAEVVKYYNEDKNT